MAGIVPFVRPVPLSGPGPFQLPKMRSAVSAGEGTWETPILRLETEQGEEVWIPMSPKAMRTLCDLAQAWCMLPQNPLKRPTP
jgi:hypothetical protein